MKKMNRLNLILLLVTFPLLGMSQTSLFFKEAFEGASKYTFETNDRIYFSSSRSAVASYTCNDRAYRVRDNEIRLYLTSTKVSSIKIHGTSTGSEPRTIVAVEVGQKRGGPFEPVKCNISSTIQALHNGCGMIEVTGLKIPVESYLKIKFNEFVNISEIEIHP